MAAVAGRGWRYIGIYRLCGLKCFFFFKPPYSGIVASL